MRSTLRSARTACACAAFLGLLLTPALRAADGLALPESVSLTADAGGIPYLLPPVLVKGEPVSMTALADVMGKYKLPGLSAAYIHDGAVAWTYCAGETRKDGLSVTADTLFQVGGLGQQVTALAVLQLVQQGKLDLDRDVNDYLKSWKIPGTTLTAQAKVTLRCLLYHRGGLNLIDSNGYDREEGMPSLTQVLKGEKPARSLAVVVEKVPGSFTLGHGADFLVIQRVVEDVTGRPFAQYMREAVFKPLGMDHSTFEQQPSERWLKQAAWPHDSKGELSVGGPRNYPEQAAWGLWSTAPDIARFAIEVQNELAGGGKALLGQALAQSMLKPAYVDIVKLAMGTMVGGSETAPWFGMGVGTSGYFATLKAYDKGDGVVILSNGDNGAWLNDQFVNTVAGTHGWPDFGPQREDHIATLPTKVLDSFTGQYLISVPMDQADFKINVTRDGKDLWIQGSGQYPFEVYPRNSREFFAKVAAIQVSFERDKQGKVLSASIHQGGQDFACKKVADSVYRHAAAGAKTPRKRSFLTMDQSAVAKDIIWCDSFYNESMTAKIVDGHFQCVFESGKRWGCVNILHSNVGPFVQGDIVDLLGYDRLKIKAKAPKGLKFKVILSEAGVWDPGLKRYSGPNGADGESWNFTPLEGSGEWKVYDLDLAQARRRGELDNQAGNDILDLQAIDSVGIGIQANQGEGSLSVESIDFVRD